MPREFDSISIMYFPSLLFIFKFKFTKMNVLLIKYLNYIQLPSVRKSIELGYDGKRQSQRSIGKI